MQWVQNGMQEILLKYDQVLVHTEDRFPCGAGVSNLGDTQSLTGHRPKEPALADPAPSRRCRGAFLPQPLCQLVKS